MTYSTPHDVIRALCEIKGEVAEKVYDYHYASDCVCGDPRSIIWGEDTEWPNSWRGSFRHDDEVIDFIRDAVREKIERQRAGHGEPRVTGHDTVWLMAHEG